MPDELVERVERVELLELLERGELVVVAGILAVPEYKITAFRLRPLTGGGGLFLGEAGSVSAPLDLEEADCLPVELTLFAIPILLHMDTTGAPSAWCGLKSWRFVGGPGKSVPGSAYFLIVGAHAGQTFLKSATA